jgi:hypothetical protein
MEREILFHSPFKVIAQKVKSSGYTGIHPSCARGLGAGLNCPVEPGPVAPSFVLNDQIANLFFRLKLECCAGTALKHHHFVRLR